jgi:patatin-like phospholipase/acyl hydrolase
MRVLAIDGGGIRGLIPALVLAEIERRTSRRIADLVDLVAGTSTGAILACALTRPDPLPARRVADLYVQEGPRIFDRSLLKIVTSVDGYLDEKYDDRGLVATLKKYLGDTKLADATVPMLVTAYDLQARAAVLLRSGDAGALSMVDAAHASSAAPTYFEPVEVTDAAGARTYPLVDGGVYAVNPAMCAYAEVVGSGSDISVIAALGTGAHTRAFDIDEVRGWGRLEWAQPVLEMVFDGVADTVDFQAATLSRGRYRRLQPELRYASDALDDAGEANLRRLQGDAERLIAERSQDIEALCEEVAG